MMRLIITIMTIIITTIIIQVYVRDGSWWGAPEHPERALGLRNRFPGFGHLGRCCQRQQRQGGDALGLETLLGFRVEGL